MWLSLCLCALATLSLHDDPLADLAARLRASDKWTRAEAVEALARIGSDEAWALVLPMLADRRGEVADAAQLALAGIGTSATLELLGREDGLRAKDALVRARVAEGLGRLPLALPKLLERALGDGEAEVQRMAAWSLERLARSGRLAGEERAGFVPELLRLARGARDERLRVRCLAALATLDARAARAPLEAAARAREGVLRGAAARLLASAFPSEELLERLRPLLADEVGAVRAQALETLGELASREAVALLVERLGAEREERLLARVVEWLQTLSGLKHRRDVRPWNDWLASLPPGWRGRPRRPEEAQDGAGELRSSVALAGLPIASKRIAILIDLSGSIWNVRPDGKTKKEVVDAKLREALEALPADTRFNLIPYTSVPIPWKERLVTASPAAVRAAASWFEERHENGSGNFWDATELALRDPEVDTLLVLFDGAPTGGHRHRLELIAPLFLEQNLGRGVTLDLVLVDASRKLQRLWGELSAATGGRAVSVSF